MKNTYNQHGNQQVFFGDLSMGEDVVEDIGHVSFVFLTQCKHTFVIMSCKQINTQKAWLKMQENFKGRAPPSGDKGSLQLIC